MFCSKKEEEEKKYENKREEEKKVDAGQTPGGRNLALTTYSWLTSGGGSMIGISASSP